ncbi:MAG: hypothetical protein ABIR79_18135 [Candidatus Binatia bacterium]
MVFLVGGAVLVGGAALFGCQSSPSERATATPGVTPARTLPPAVATKVLDRFAEEPRTVPTTLSAPTALRTIVPVAPMAPPVAPAPTRVVPVPPRADGTVPAQPAEPVAPYAAMPTAQPIQPRPPRAFRTPERAGDPAFVPPQGNAATGDTASDAEGAAAAAPNAAGQRATSGVVIFRATARTAVEGFDVRVTYPTSLGHFTATNNQVDCTGAAGAIVTASDRGNGELRLLVASAQALTLPFDVFCRFTVAAGARLSTGAFETRVAEVASNLKKADPGLVLIDVVVR